MLRRIFSLLLLSALSAIAEPKFIPPDETRPLIKRELLPLDVDAMYRLGSDLAVLANQPGSNNASTLRYRAKLLSLSQRLHPTLPKTRRILGSLTEGKFQASKKNNAAKAARQSLTQTATWLLKTSANSEGHKLGLLILDILPPGNALSNRRDPATEDLRWAEVIAPLAAFQNKKTKPEPVEPKAPEKPQKYLTTTLITKFPFFGSNTKTNQTGARLQSVTLVINKDGNDLSFSPPLLNQPLGPLHRALRNFFKKAGTPLPRQHRLFVDTSGVRYLKINAENIATPLAMMLDSALSGTALRPDAILFARLRADASLEPPAQSWPLLQALRKSNVPRGTRLIVPPSLEDQLLGLLAQEVPDFFLKYEVLSASTFDEARELFYQNRDTDPTLAKASIPFNEVRQKAPSNSNLGHYLSLDSVRSRLTRAAKASNHLSAKFLLLQSKGKRPSKFTRGVLARELHDLLRPLQSFNHKGRSERSTKSEYTELRDTLESLDRLTDISDRPLIEDARDLIKKLPGIARGMDQEFPEQSTRDAINKLRANTTTFRQSLEKHFAKPRG